MLCWKGVAHTLVVFLSLREAFGRGSMAALHRNMGRQDRAPGTSHPPLTLAEAAVGFPQGSGRTRWRPALAEMYCGWGGFLRILVSSRAVC